MLRGRGARKDALAKAAELDGVTSWSVTLNLIGDAGYAGGLADALSAKAGTTSHLPQKRHTNSKHIANYRIHIYIYREREQELV